MKSKQIGVGRETEATEFGINSHLLIVFDFGSKLGSQHFTVSFMKILASVSLFLTFTIASLRADAQITWQQTHGPEGGAISTVCVDSIDHVLIATKAGGIFESADS